MKKVKIDPYLDELENSKGYYLENATCRNCYEEVRVLIPQGQIKPKTKYICKNCGCKTLEII